MSSSPIASRSVVTFQDKSASWNGQNRNTLIHASDKVDHGSRALTTPKPPVVSRGTDSPTRFHPMPRRKMMPAARPRRAPDDAKAPIPTPGFYNDAADSKRPRAYFSFFALAPLTLAVPRSVFCRFLRCLPARGVSTLLCCNGNDIWLDGIDAGSRHQGKAGGLAATELGSQAEDLDLVLLGLVHATELLAELLLGDVGTAGVEDVTEAESAACSSILWSCSVRRCRRHCMSSRPWVPGSFLDFATDHRGLPAGNSPRRTQTDRMAVLMVDCRIRGLEDAAAGETTCNGDDGERTGAGKLTRPSACGPAEGCG
ncbi:hypothetical protein ACCO45_000145 [Purpureocillium lilacinum]|uniref:Uncharacterized protein n=1 Tax=Purpureocillium lilacinum TaxID=33203 RepID=A0ACC4E3U4_PURLI